MLDKLALIKGLPVIIGLVLVIISFIAQFVPAMALAIRIRLALNLVNGPLRQLHVRVLALEFLRFVPGNVSLVARHVCFSSFGLGLVSRLFDLAALLFLPGLDQSQGLAKNRHKLRNFC